MTAPTVPAEVEEAINQLDQEAHDLGWTSAVHEENPVNEPKGDPSGVKRALTDLRAAILTALAEAEKRGEERHVELLRHVAEWARGRQKLADEEAEQGGEEFSDIARRCEEKIRAPQDGKETPHEAS